MNNQLPEDWEPGNNIKWESGYDSRARIMAASFLMLLLAGISFLTVCAALLSSCAMFTNRGEAFQKGVFEKHNSIARGLKNE